MLTELGWQTYNDISVCVILYLCWDKGKITEPPVAKVSKSSKRPERKVCIMLVFFFALVLSINRTHVQEIRMLTHWLSYYVFPFAQGTNFRVIFPSLVAFAFQSLSTNVFISISNHDYSQHVLSFTQVPSWSVASIIRVALKGFLFPPCGFFITQSIANPLRTESTLVIFMQSWIAPPLTQNETPSS